MREYDKKVERKSSERENYKNYKKVIKIKIKNCSSKKYNKIK